MNGTFVLIGLASVLLSTGGVIATQGGDIQKASVPDCSSVDRFPTMSAFTALQNAGMVGVGSLPQWKRTTTRIASEEIRPGLFRQVHHVIFAKGQESIELMTVNDVSMEECSESASDVYLIRPLASK